MKKIILLSLTVLIIIGITGAQTTIKEEKKQVKIIMITKEPVNIVGYTLEPIKEYFNITMEEDDMKGIPKKVTRQYGKTIGYKQIPIYGKEKGVYVGYRENNETFIEKIGIINKINQQTILKVNKKTICPTCRCKPYEKEEGICT